MTEQPDDVSRFRAELDQRSAHAKRVLDLGPDVVHPLSDVVRSADGPDDVPAWAVELFRRAEEQEPWSRAGEMPPP
ncbi:hypothetical protein [Pseudonocardia zijingensis]